MVGCFVATHARWTALKCRAPSSPNVLSQRNASSFEGSLVVEIVLIVAAANAIVLVGMSYIHSRTP